MENKKKNYFSNTFFIGLLSFFGGISQDMFIPILPLYLANVLHLDKEIIGLAEGLVTSSASIFRFIAGFLSDKFRKNKPIIFLGYFLSMVARPLLALTSFSGTVLFLRFLDGVGKGIKDSPKDALIADSVKKEKRGIGFGIVRALDTFGSVIGPLILFAFLYFLKNNSLKYHYIFFITAIPLVFTLLIITFFVKEVPFVNKNKTDKNSSILSKRFYVFLGIVLLFSIGNSSDAFLVLRAQNVGVTLLAIPLVYALFNFVYASFSIPLGSLSDKIGRKKVIVLGWVFYGISYLGFAVINKSIEVWLMFSFYGIYYATTEGVVKAFVADLVSPENRGKAYGIYNSLIGLITLPASLIAGFLWDRINPSAPFLFGSGIAFLAVICLLIFERVYRINRYI